MITPSLIRITQNNIDRSFSDLEKEISNYTRNKNTIQVNLNRLQNIKKDNRIDMYAPQGLELLSVLNDANTHMTTINARSLREIDAMTAAIAAYLALLIDECIENYNPKLKIWIKMRLDQLNQLREIKIQEMTYYIIFPTAVATLTPYIIKTRMCAEDISSRLVSIRNIIRRLSEPSY